MSLARCRPPAWRCVQPPRPYGLPVLLNWLVGSSDAPRRVVDPDVPASGATSSSAVPTEVSVPTEVTVDHVWHQPNAAVVISKLHAGEVLVHC